MFKASRISAFLLLSALVLPAFHLSSPAWGKTPADTLVIGVASDPAVLDPAVSSDNFDWRVSYPAYDRLVKFKVVNGEGSTEVEPMAAESWTVSEDGKTWTFKIRPGITVSDGSPLDAAAVKFSFDRLMKIAMGPAGNLECLASTEAPDASTVVFTLKYPFAPFLQILAINGCSIINPAVMKHEKDGDMARGWLAENTDGSGPFTLRQWKRGERLIMEARPGYWGGEPKIKRVILRPMREASDRRLALEKGDIDITESILMDQLPALEKNPDVAVRRYDGQFVEYVYVNNTRPALSDKRVRQALNYAVDFKGIIDFVLQGNGDQAISPIPKGMWGHDDKAFRYERNPEKARALLAEAGVKDLSLTLIYSERRAVWEQIATILQSNFADIGVKLDLVLLSNATLRDRMGNGDFDLCLGAWSPDFADPYMFANLWYDSANAGMAGNRSFYSNPKVDDLLRKAARSTNQAERVDLYKQVQDIVIDDAAYILLYQLKAVVPMRTNVKGFVFNPMLESMYNIESMWKE